MALRRLWAAAIVAGGVIPGLFVLTANAAAEESAAKVPLRADRFGDPLPPAAQLRLGTVRWRPGEQVTDLAVSPDGKIVASAGEAGVHLWEAASGKVIRQLQQERADAVLFSPDGASVLARSWERVRVWQSATGQEQRQFSLRVRPLRAINDFAISANLKRGASIGSRDGQPGCVLHFWDLDSGKELRQWNAPTMPGHLALSPDGKVLAWSTYPDVIHVWDTDTGKPLRQLCSERHQVWRLSFAPDGKRLASVGRTWNGKGASDDSEFDNKKATALVWEVDSGKKLHELAGNKSVFAGNWMYSLAFSPDGSSLATGGGDHTLRLWDLTTGQQRHVLEGHTSTVNALAFSGDGKSLFAGDNSSMVRVWDPAAGKERAVNSAGHAGWVQEVAWLDDGKIVASHGDQTVRFWNALTGEQLRQFGPVETSGLNCAVFSPTRKIMAALTYPYEKVVLWDMATGGKLRHIDLPEQFTTFAFSPDGKLLAGGTRKIVLWDVASGREVRGFRAHAEDIWSLAFSPDGKVLVSGGGDNLVRVWETATGKRIREIPVPTTPDVMAIAPDGRSFATAGFDQMIRLWDLASGTESRQLMVRPQAEHDDESRVLCLAFSPDGKLLASGGWARAIRLWEVASGKEIRRIEGHRGGVLSLGFSPDGRRLLSGSQDTTALLWHVPELLLQGAAATAPTPRELDRIWELLAGDDAAHAYRAAATLASFPKISLPWLAQRLRPVTPVDAGRLDRLLANLENDDFTVRQTAALELEKLGDQAVPALEKALRNKPSLDTQRRLEQLLARSVSGRLSPDTLRGLRVVHILEIFDFPEVKPLLATLARGEPAARITREAQAALLRLEQQKP